MKTDIQSEIDKDKFRKKLTRYTWRAYNMIPGIKAPFILDIGCGTGIPTIDLAVLSKGKITAIDIDRKALGALKDKITVLHLSAHIRVVRCSMEKLHFKKESFDILWAEGSIAVIGFEKGLREWRRFIKPGGFLVVHDEIRDYREKMKYIPQYEYSLKGHFMISDQVWFDEYFIPLENHTRDLQVKYKNNREIIKVLEQEMNEIKLVKQSPGDFATIFYVMQKM